MESKANKDSVADNSHTILEMYKLHTEMADRVSQRRNTTNNLFVTINTSIITASIFIFAGNLPNKYIILVAIFILGIALSFVWKNLINSYKKLNTAKFKALDLLENKLPIKFYEIEYKAYQKLKRKDFSDIEKCLPTIFMALYFLGVLIIGISCFSCV